MHETIEGEVIVIDLETGSYYSLRDTSAQIWHGIETGANESTIADSLHGRYDATREEIATAVGKLVDELVDEGLIEAEEGGTATVGQAVAPPQDGNMRVPFLTPVLEKHTDMQDLILLDPVHDVNEAGWPHVAPPGGA